LRSQLSTTTVSYFRSLKQAVRKRIVKCVLRKWKNLAFSHDRNNTLSNQSIKSIDDKDEKKEIQKKEVIFINFIRSKIMENNSQKKEK
jgi:hypothetical protein